MIVYKSTKKEGSFVLSVDDKGLKWVSKAGNGRDG